MPVKNGKDTIVSLSSGLEKSAVALIRLSGEKCFATASLFLKPAEKLKSPTAGVLLRLEAVDDAGELLDRVLAVSYLSPKSYTGEDMLEIFCHGSPYIVRNIISTAIKSGARQAMPGEFTFRAYLNGKMDLMEAEAVNDLINSETTREHSAAISQLKGELGGKIKDLKSKLVGLLAEMEVRIDDTYEETPPLDIKSFSDSLSALREEISSMARSFEKGRFVKNGVNTVICGLPNCGKSSLLNRLAGYNRAIVSPLAGTTRDTIEEKAEIAGFKFIFTDTAGLTEASDPVEKEGVKRSEKAIEKADLILFLKDSSTPETKTEKDAFLRVKSLKREKTPLLEIFSKSDLTQARKPGNGQIALSSLTGKGMPELMKSLEAFCLQVPAASGSIITSARHFTALSAAARDLQEAEKIVSSGAQRYELLAEAMRLALSDLADVAGETQAEDVLDRIFSEFCVGK
ncbi:MAG: tRNA uridine-5-carboxymethylaminomethyl(34) synthesis GTPase MnmE [Elusimicrobiota bacterium]